MAGINLLPWRENLRKERLKQFGKQMIGALIIAGLGAGFWHLQMASKLEHQENRNKLVRDEIVKVDAKIKEIKEMEKVRAQLISRMDVIQDLQISRPQAVHLFDEVVETIPDGTFLASLDQKGKKVTLKGHAQSNARVSSYMRNIDASDWIGRAQLQVVGNKKKKASSVRGMSKFTLVATQLNPNKEK